jgi:UDP-glucose 4-epimerase
MSTIFLTGSDSFVGRAFGRYCLNNAIEVIGIDASSNSGSDGCSADIRDKDIVDLIPLGCDAIVHLAALSSDSLCRGKTQECFDVNVMGTLNIIEAAKQRSVKQFIFASTEWVYTEFGDTPKIESTEIDVQKIVSEYALSKIISEQNLRQTHKENVFDITILRFGIIYGPRMVAGSAVENLFISVGKNELITVGSKETARQFLHVSDAADAISAVIGTRGFNCFNVQGPNLISLQDVIDESSRIWDIDAKVVELDPSSPSIRRVSGEKIHRALGWSAAIGLKDGLMTLRGG